MKTETIFILSFVITAAFETVTALFFKIRRARDLGVVLLSNILTNPLLNLFYMLAVLKMGIAGARIVLIMMEALVITGEALIYRKLIPSLAHPFLFSLTANLLSFCGGTLMTILKNI